MPIERQPAQVPEVNPENEPFVLSPEQIRDAMALQVVNQTFSVFESYRTNNHDARWTEADALYGGYVPTKVWDGTTIPRANLPYQISFDQVESAYPSIMQALFSDENWFEVRAEPGTPAEAARAVHAAMSYMLDHAKNDYGLTSIAEIGLAIRDMLKYGNGGVWLDWDGAKQRVITSWVDLRDVYIDPATPTPNADESRAIIRRRMMTVDEISALRGNTLMSIPSDEVLWYMAKSAPTVAADTTRQAQESLRSVNYSPAQADYIPNPADRKIEVLMYYSKNQIIWVLNRQHVAYNNRNPYGFIPCAFAPCYIFTGRFYANGIPDVQRGNQRMIEGLLNGHLDEISLSLHPPRVQAQNGNLTNGQRKWGPGYVFNSTSTDLKNSISLLQPQPVTQNVMGDIGFILDAADKRTGINAMAQGMPKPGNANRTATGMSLQSQGAANRIQPLVKNIEDFLLVPLLRKMYKMVAFHIGAFDKMPAKLNGEVQWIDGWNFQRPCDFEMLAASKMLAKSNLMQIFPFVTQYLLSGPLMEALKSAGQTVNFQALIDMLQDAAGTRGRYDIIRPMTPQEQQAAQQPPPQVQAQMQMEQAKQQNAKEIIGMKIQGDLQKTMLANQSSPEELQMKMAESQQKMQIEQMKAEIQMALQQQKLETEQQLAQMKLQLEQARSRQQIQSGQQKLLLDQQAADLKLQQEQEKSMVTLQSAMLGNQQKLRQSEESHQMSLRQQKQSRAAEEGRQPSGNGKMPRKKAAIRRKGSRGEE